jgi:hypothetical protein
MPQGQNQQQANAQPSRSRAAAPYRFDEATSQHDAAYQKTSAPSVSLPGVNEFLAGVPAEPPVTLPPFSSFFTRPPSQFKSAPANPTGSQARVPRAQGYGENDYFASANTVMPAQQPGEATSSPHSFLPIGMTVPEEQRLALPRPSAIPMRLIPEPSSRLPNLSTNQANDSWAQSGGALTTSSVAGTIAPTQQTVEFVRVATELAVRCDTYKKRIIVDRKTGRPLQAHQSDGITYGRFRERRLVNPDTGEFLRVNQETGEIAGDVSEEEKKRAITYGAYRSRASRQRAKQAKHKVSYEWRLS